MAVWIVSVVFACIGYADTIDVYPGPGTPIQSAITAAKDGDVIVVHPGTYPERISFLGRKVTVRGTDPGNPDTVAATVIDGQAAGSVVTFASGEPRASVLEGLTVYNAKAGDGGGILCYDASPTLRKCLITGNAVCSGGGGICCGSSSSPLIQANTISSNPTGGGVSCAGNSNAEIVGNTFSRNQNQGHTGGAIKLDSGTASVSGNVFDGNSADGGGALSAWAVRGLGVA